MPKTTLHNTKSEIHYPGKKLSREISRSCCSWWIFTFVNVHRQGHVLAVSNHNKNCCRSVTCPTDDSMEHCSIFITPSNNNYITIRTKITNKLYTLKINLGTKLNIDYDIINLGNVQNINQTISREQPLQQQ